MTIKKDFKCPKCGGQLEMIEHYDYHDGWELFQEQNYECMGCHRYVTQLRVWYKMSAYEWASDDEGDEE